MSSLVDRLPALESSLSARGFVRGPARTEAVWTGMLDGRECVVRVAAQRRTRYSGDVRQRTLLGYRLRVEFATTVRTQLYLVPRQFPESALIRWIYRLRRYRVIAPLAEPLQDFAAVTIDQGWSERLIALSDIAQDVAWLLSDGRSPTLAGSVHLAPTSASGRLWYASPIVGEERLGSEQLQKILDAMQRLVAGAEDLPAPQVVREVSAFGRLGERYPWAIAVGLPVGGMAILGLLALAVVFGAAIIVGLAR